MMNKSKKYNVIVNATALTTSGALTILYQFLENAAKDNNNFICFVPYGVSLPEYKNIKYIPLKKKGWLKRIIWDSYGINHYLKNKNIIFNKIISLQNTSVNTKKQQFIYLHQSLPFSRVNFLSSKYFSIKLFLYKQFYSYFIFQYIRSDTIFVVQTNWIKDELEKRIPNQIHIIRPDFKLPGPIKSQNASSDKVILLYPAIPVVYKNHLVILESLKNIIIDNKDIILQVTFRKGQYSKFDKLVNKYKLMDNVEYLGYIDYSEMMAAYSSANIILFPSFLETFGLPLLEASSLNKMIICSDLPYAKDALSGYTNVEYIKFDDPKLWENSIRKHINNKEIFNIRNPNKSNQNTSDNWSDFFKLL